MNEKPTPTPSVVSAPQVSAEKLDIPIKADETSIFDNKLDVDIEPPKPTEPVVSDSSKPKPVEEVTDKPDATEWVSDFTEITKQNVTLISDPCVIGKDKANTSWFPEEEIMGMPQFTTDGLQQALSSLPNLDLGDSEEVIKWKQRLTQGLESGTFDDVFVKALSRANSQWVNGLQHKGQNISSGYPRFKSNERTLSGEKGAIQLASHIGQGAVHQQTLYHSGFHITFKPPGEDQIIEINRLLLGDKIKFGRESYGAVFANTGVYIIRRLMEFALGNVYSHTVQLDKTGTRLEDLISMHDYYAVLAGLGASMYPRGLLYETACCKEPTTCRHIAKVILNLSKLMYTDESCLSETQRVHLTKRSANSMTVESIKKYQEELLRLSDKQVEFTASNGSNVTITFKCPTVAENITLGQDWVDEIIRFVERTAGSGSTEQEKESLFTNYSLASYLNRYRHFIKEISMAGADPATDQNDIKRHLPVLSSDTKLRADIETSIKDFLNDTTISIAGIPLYDCEACGHTQVGEVTYPRHQNIIPIDVQSVFFQLLSRRLKTILKR